MPEGPYLQASCTAHGTWLPACDPCATTRVMSAWAASLGEEELAAALDAMTRNRRYYTFTEARAILTEAAARIRDGS